MSNRPCSTISEVSYIERANIDSQSPNRATRAYCNPSRSVEGTVSLIDGTIRVNDIRRRILDVTTRMLTNQLRELELDGLIVRKMYAQVPPKVEYSMSSRGKALQRLFGNNAVTTPHTAISA